MGDGDGADGPHGGRWDAQGVHFREPLEDREILLDFQATVLRTAVDRGLELVIESRTEQLTPEKLAWATSINPSFTVAIGLEAHDDEVLRFHVNKGFTVASAAPSRREPQRCRPTPRRI